MVSRRILAIALAAALSCPAFAQSPQALKHLSGEFRLNSGLDLTDAGTVPFSAQLFSRTGEVCQLNGQLLVRDGSPRRVETGPGATFIHCPGTAPALVVGHVVPADWTPPQSRRCRSYGYRSSCVAYSVTVPAGASGRWITWHALTSEQAAPQKELRND
jgi:hypothetical protein